MLKTRIITALILVSLVVFTTFYLEPVWFLFILSLFIFISIWEWFKLFPIRNKDEYFMYWLLPILYFYALEPFVLGALSITAVGFFERSVVIFQIFYLPLVFFWLIIAPLVIISREKYIKHVEYKPRYPEANSIYDPFRIEGPDPWRGIIIGPRGTFFNFFLGNFLLWGMWLILVILLFYNPYILLLLFLIIWSADIVAYFSGKKYGKHMLASNISPNKTWEGVIGGLVAGISTTFLALYFFGEFLGVDIMQASSVKLILLSSVTVIYSIIGDLFISTIKRNAEKKDTGALFPGHGGVIDRIDSLMAGSVAFILCGIHLELFGFGFYK